MLINTKNTFPLFPAFTKTVLVIFAFPDIEDTDGPLILPTGTVEAIVAGIAIIWTGPDASVRDGRIDIGTALPKFGLVVGPPGLMGITFVGLFELRMMLGRGEEFVLSAGVVGWLTFV